ncbi:hypothetical protein QSV34_07025 [Porticoccus sp. W117]|uniref:hypothetical protein n=1 Tax=Porticoccus sp. W117 TaxID=3054777 RepID=UPI0025969B20|nr:hypothetical protein [Porticoccus sp. W117]MDM3871108.1 hypothetical protein [Porticoccus sp. W117]
MHFAPDEAIQIARMLQVLKRGEEVAADCARLQAQLKAESSPKVAKFLRSQSRQEMFHARTIQAGMLWVAPKARRNLVHSPAMETLYRRCVQAVQDGRYAESVLAVQIVLEGMGETVLRAIDSQMEQRRLGLKKLRHIIVHQEVAHHTFGLRELDRAIADEGLEATDVVRLSQEYLHLSEQIFAELDGVFDYFGASQQQFQASVQGALPGWLQAAV